MQYRIKDDLSLLRNFFQLSQEEFARELKEESKSISMFKKLGFIYFSNYASKLNCD